MSIAVDDKTTTVSLPSERGQPVWELALLRPRQGEWTEAEYLALTSENWMIEFSDGCLEFLAMPTLFHQNIVLFIYTALSAFVASRKLGKVSVSPVPVRLGSGKFREPDVMFFKAGRVKDVHKPPDGVDLAVEVVSPDPESRKRDLEEKPADYAEAKVPEYWIVDPKLARITVLRLNGEAYAVHGTFGTGAKATSVLLPGFELEAEAVFAAGLKQE
jgi:Uma2 family endonuclease